ncbi:MAG: hypothetical protein ACOH1V_10270 [Stenotrophomonas sp.]
MKVYFIRQATVVGLGPNAGRLAAAAVAVGFITKVDSARRYPVVCAMAAAQKESPADFGCTHDLPFTPRTNGNGEFPRRFRSTRRCGNYGFAAPASALAIMSSTEAVVIGW